MAEFDLFRVTINTNDRIDKDRANSSTPAKIFSATIKDAGKPFHGVAKVTLASGDEDLERLHNCAETHRLLDHQRHITQIFGMHEITKTDLFGTEKRFILLMEKAEGSVRDLIDPKTPEMDALRRKLFGKMSHQEILRQTADGLAYIHSKTDSNSNYISHRDVKPGNLLIFPRDRDGAYNIKYTDFDSSKELTVDSNKVSSVRLTPQYLDPNIEEIKAKGGEVSIKDYLAGDVFSCGLVFFEVLTPDGRYMFKGIIKPDQTNLMNAKVDELGRNMIMIMTWPDPKGRPQMVQVLKLPYFMNVNDHLQNWNAITQVIQDFDDSPESNAMKDDLEDSFFMVFEEPWQDKPYVVEAILLFNMRNPAKPNKPPKTTLWQLIRLLRNMFIHAQQHKQALKDHFGVEVSALDILREVLKPDGSPRVLMHLYWFAQRRLSDVKELKFIKEFPEGCVVAYEKLMEHEKDKIEKNGGMDALRVKCQLPVKSKPNVWGTRGANITVTTSNKLTSFAFISPKKYALY